MTLEPAGRLVAEAAAAGRGVAACNMITLEHGEAIIAGAERAGQPVILQISQNAVKFHGGRLRPVARAAQALAEAAPVPVALHLDHVDREDLLRQAPECGFGSVMYDASKLPYRDNVAATRSAVRFAHEHGLWLESELGEVGGKDGAHAPGVRTDPDQAARFVAETGVDALAVAVGSRHAMTSRTATLDQDLIRRLREAVAVPLVLHGSSGVPGGELSRAVRHGMVKINIGTALNLAFTDAVRAHLAENPRTVDPRRYLSDARDAMAEVVAGYCRRLAAP
ncbi:MAG TPA: class II fructose-bisphosphate aldolase [Micromonosporaceae bacterium]